MGSPLTGGAGDGWAQGRAAADRDEVCAALDLGTNNCRLLVARPAAGGFQVIDAFSRIVRLGEGLQASGRLGEAAMARTLDALKVCRSKIRRRRVTRLRAVATEACRRAGNCADFLDRVRAETGLELEIISQTEEARLALLGCAPLLDPAMPEALIFDIGGGSTEVCWLAPPAAGAANGERPAAAAGLRACRSLPLGVVTLAERYGGHHVDAAVYGAMVAEVRGRLAGFEREHRLAAALGAGRLQMLGTSGTVTTIAGVHQCLPRYDRARVDGCYLEAAVIESVSRRILAMSFEERAAQPCIGRQRADLVIAGCAVLQALLETWPARRLRVADRGLREGILFTLMRPPRPAAAAPCAARLEPGLPG